MDRAGGAGGAQRGRGQLGLVALPVLWTIGSGLRRFKLRGVERRVARAGGQLGIVRRSGVVKGADA